MQDWKKFLASIAKKDRSYQINAIDTYVNQVRYVDDRRRFGRSDYWATPNEFFGRGGDCEDYAIAKYLSLKHLGFDTSKMRLVVLKDTSIGINHAVLVVYHKGEALVLDNQARFVVPARKIAHYKPYYSVNEKHWWLHKKPAPRHKPLVVAQRSRGEPTATQ